MRDPNWPLVKHFVHCMQYMYYIASVVIEYPDKKYIIQEPNVSNWKSAYVNSFLEKLLSVYPNIKFSKNINYENALVFTHNAKIEGEYIINENVELRHQYKKWFPYDNSKIMRYYYLNATNNKSQIGIISRKQTRQILNEQELLESISKKFNCEVDLTNFDDKDFDYQINYFNEHQIIISPHGAELCSIPFMKQNSLIIECAHDEWHPYDYFPGLSYTTNMVHAMLVDDHSCFPNNASDKYIEKHGDYEGRSANNRLNIIVDIPKVIKVIEKFKLGKLQTKMCNLF